MAYLFEAQEKLLYETISLKNIPEYRLLHKYLPQVDSIYFFGNSNKIGDTIISIGFLRALYEGLNIYSEGINRSPPAITAIWNPSFMELVAPVKQLFPNTTVLSLRPDSDERQFLEQQNLDGQNVLALDFQKYKGGRFSFFGIAPIIPTISHYTDSNSDILAVANLFGHGVERFLKYPREAKPARRYAAYIEELFDLPHGVLGEGYEPYLPMSPDGQVINSSFRKRNKLPPKNTPEVSVVLEASSEQRCYSFDNWIKTAEILLYQYPQLRFNFIYNPTSIPERMRREITYKAKLFRSAIAHNAQPAYGSLSELAAFFTTQDVVASNDTGAAHLSAAVGTPTISLWSPNSDFNPQSWHSHTLLHQLEITDEELKDNNVEFDINGISPSRVAREIALNLQPYSQ